MNLDKATVNNHYPQNLSALSHTPLHFCRASFSKQLYVNVNVNMCANFVFIVLRYSVIVQPGDSSLQNSPKKGETSSEAGMDSGKSKDGKKFLLVLRENVALLLWPHCREFL